MKKFYVTEEYMALVRHVYELEAEDMIDAEDHREDDERRRRVGTYHARTYGDVDIEILEEVRADYAVEIKFVE